MKRNVYVILFVILTCIFFITSCNYEQQIHEHKFNDEYKCDEQYHVRECECGYIEQLEHNYVDSIVSATCDADGMKTTQCLVCNYSLPSEIIPALGHDIKYIESVEPTCIEVGHTEGLKCSRCEYSEGLEIIPALDHDFKSEITLPTCNNNGYTKYTCYCGYIFIDDYVDALGHEIIIDKGIAATCTSSGITQGQHCNRCDYKVEQQIIPANGHKVDKVVVENNILPTCTTAGSYDNVIYCVVCNEELVRSNVTIDATGHTYKSETILSTCTNKGFTLYICHCGDTYIDSYVDALGHNIVIDEKVDPTCTQTGLTEGKHCNRCDYVESQSIIPASGHTFISLETLPTCEEKGYTNHVCFCGYSYKDSYLDELGHQVLIDPAKSPTCTEQGLTEGSHCFICSKVLVSQEIVPALGHDLIIDEAIAPSCNKPGLTEGKHCTKCEYIEPQIIVPALGHTEGEVVVENNILPTCTECGTFDNVIYCNMCNEELQRNTITVQPLGHTYHLVVTLPTCTEKGFTTHVCNCGNVYVDTYVNELGHEIIIDEAVEATCTQTGLAEGKHCNKCEYVETQSIIPALGHSYESFVTNPTCTEHGYTTNICYCGDTYISFYVEALGHEIIIDEAVKSTCTTAGLTEGKHCSVCNEVLVEQNVVPALGHTESDAVVENNVLPTCTTTGSYDNVIYCTVCEEKLSRETIVVAALGHIEVIDEAVEATCTQTGLTEGKHCSVCNDVLVSQNVINALGHNESNVVVENNLLPTCTTAGSYDNVIYCTVCDEELSRETIVVAALGHIEVIDEAVAATCTQTGLTEGKYCSVCNEVLVEQNLIEALGHDVVVHEGKTPTCTTLGYNDFETCKVCDYSTYEEQNFKGHNFSNDICTDCSEPFVENPETIFKFKLLENNTYEIIEFIDNTISNLTIPSIYNDKLVTSIGYDVFYNNTTIQSITIPSTIKTMKGECFYTWNLNKVYYLGTIEDWCNIEFMLLNGFTGSVNPMYRANEFYMLDSSNYWYEVTEIVIPNTITTIGKFQFAGFKNITNIFISESVTEIKEFAFFNCSSLIVIDIPDSVLEIASYAFFDCTNLESVVLPSNLKYLSSCIFMECESLKNIEIPNSVTSIGGWAFYECKELVSIVIPENVTEIDTEAFSYCVNLVRIFIPNNIAYISEKAFNNCAKLTIYCEATSQPFEWDDRWNFSKCPVIWGYIDELYHECFNLKYISQVLPTCEEEGHFIYQCVNCNQYVNIKSKDALGHMEVIDEAVEATCTQSGLTEGKHCSVCNEVLVPQNVINALGHTESDVVVENNVLPTCTIAGSYDNVIYCTVCEEELSRETIVVAPLGHTEVIDEAVEATCTQTGLTEGKHCSVCDEVLVYQNIVNTLGHTESDVVVENNVLPTCTTSGSYDNVTYCTVCDEELSREIIVISSTGHKYVDHLCNICHEYKPTDGFIFELLSNGTYQIVGCEGCTEARQIIPSVFNGICVTSISSNAFENCANMADIILPSSINHIESNAFKYNYDLMNVYYTGSLYDWCNIAFENEYSNPMSYGQHFYTRDSDYKFEEKFELIIPENIASIGGYQFYNFDNITNVLLPKNIIIINSYAFNKCDKLEKIYIPNSIESIGTSAFANCSNLKNVIFESKSKLTKFDNRTFYGCQSLENIILPDNLVYLESSVFSSCSNLKDITIPSSLTIIDNYCFDYCFALENVYYLGTIEQWCNIEFSYNSNPMFYGDHFYILDQTNNFYELTEIVIPDTITSINNYQFEGFSNVLNITLPSTLKSIEYSALRSMSGIISIELPPSLSEIGQCAFMGCINLVEINIPKNVSVIGNNAFNNCYNLEKVSFEDNSSLTSVNAYTFANCSSLEKVNIPNSVNSINDGAFKNCENLKYIEIPINVKVVKSRIFDGISNIVIFCEASKPHQLWNDDWNYNDMVVFWSYNRQCSSGNCHEMIYVGQQEPSCELFGYKEGARCLTCGYTIGFEQIDFLDHNLIHYDSKAPTCTEQGWNVYYICSRCDYNTYEAIEALGHTYESVVTNSTCTEQGYTTYTCHCGDIYIGDYINELGHNLIIDEAVQPTCTETGLSEGKHCNICDFIEEQSIIPAIGHIESEDIVENNIVPTCTTTGSYDNVSYCTVCAEELSRETIIVAALGHIEVIDEAVQATCTQAGLTEGKHCSVCNEVLVSQNIVNVLGHIESDVVVENNILPTCTEQGSYENVVYCSKCNEELEREIIYINALGHVYESSLTAPTCTEQGYTTYTCHCGYSYIDNYVSKLGHDLVVDEAVSATCTTTGLTEGMHCNKCNYIEAQTIIPVIGHNEVIVEGYEPTCTEAGLSEGTHCLTCGEITIQQEVINPIGHQILSYSENVINYTVINDSKYPFKISDSLIVSTNKSNSSSSTFTIKAERDFTLQLEYMVSSESSYDYLIIKHNSTQKVKTSGTSIITYKQLNINLVKGDVVTVTYSKDSSSSEGSDCCYVKVNTSSNVIIESTELKLIPVTEYVINNLRLCNEDLKCEVCNYTIIAATSNDHNYVCHEELTATCMNKGHSLYYTCSNELCSYIRDYEEYEIVNHNFVDDICTNCQVHITSKDLDYSLSSDGNSYIVNGIGTCTESNIVLNMYNNKPITKIESSVFSSYTKLTSITIPSTIQSIGLNAFSRCSNLESVYIYDLTAWCNITFAYESEREDGVTDYWCSSNPLSYASKLYVNNVLITNLVIPEGVEKISAFAFYYFELGELTLPSTLKEIGECAFEGCKLQGELILPEGLTRINHYAFSSCSNLTSVKIPSTLTYIGEYGFKDCNNLTSVCIVDLVAWCNITFDYVSDHDDGLWMHCASNPLYFAKNLYLNENRISNLVIPEEVTNLKPFVFQGGNFSSISFSSNITKIPNGAFESCSNIHTVYIPNTITDIGYYAFAYCSNLTNLYIPISVTTICDYAILQSSKVTVYCQASKEPNGWYYDWNLLKRPVVYGVSM